MNITKDKLEIFESANLQSGSHASFEAGVCAMELVSYIAGEKFSDHPQCACPSLTSYVMTLNDNFTNDERQLLKPYLLKLIGSRDGKEQERAHFLCTTAVTVFAPFALEKAGLKTEADKLRTVNTKDLKEMESAAWSAARSEAAGSAARSAESAAKSAAWSTAWSAAWSAESAAGSAAWSAESAAGSAVKEDEKKKARLEVVNLALKALEDAINIK